MKSIYLNCEDFKRHSFPNVLIEIRRGMERHCFCSGIADPLGEIRREAELLPVPYFHVVYTLPSKLRDIAYHNKRVVYDLLMKASVAGLAV